MSGEDLVQSSASASQVASFLSGGFSNAWAQDFFQFGDGRNVNRNNAISYAALNRCVTLIGSILSQLICNGMLKVIDANGNRVNNRRTQQVLYVLADSFDYRGSPATQFIEDGSADYCLDGNALFVPAMDSDGVIRSCRRMRPWDAYGTWKDGEMYYGVTDADDDISGQYTVEYIHRMDMMHVRWPRLVRYGHSRTSRQGFSVAPVVALRPALHIGCRQTTKSATGSSTVHAPLPTSISLWMRKPSA